MGVITLSALLVAGAGFYLFSRAFPNYKPGMKKLQADLKALLSELDGIQVELIPLNVKELEAFSTRQVEQSSRKRFTKTSKGAFVSIFEEPVFKYARRTYASGRGDAVAIAKTKKHQFSYLERPKFVQFVVDDQVLGAYDPKTGTLTGARSKKPIAQLDRSHPEQNLLTIHGREVASMNKLSAPEKGKLSQRVFDYVVSSLTAEEQALVKAVTIYELVALTGD